MANLLLISSFFLTLSYATFPTLPYPLNASIALGFRPEYTDLLYFTIGNLTYEYNFQVQQVVRVTNISFMVDYSFPTDCPGPCNSSWIEGFNDMWRWNSRPFFFKGALYFRGQSSDGKFSSWSLITNGWIGLDNDADALCEENRFFNYMFKGDQVWRYDVVRDRTQWGPRNMSDEFPGLPFNVDTCIRHPGTDLMLFFKGSQYWVFDKYANRLFDPNPRNIAPVQGTCVPRSEISSLMGFFSDKFPPNSDTPYLPNTNCSWRIYSPLLYTAGTRGELFDEQQELFPVTFFDGLRFIFTQFNLGTGDYLEVWANKDRFGTGVDFHDDSKRVLMYVFNQSNTPILNQEYAFDTDSKSVTLNFISNGDSDVGTGFDGRYYVANKQIIDSLIGPTAAVKPFGSTNTSLLIRPLVQTSNNQLSINLFFHMNAPEWPARGGEAYILVYNGTSANAPLTRNCSFLAGHMSNFVQNQNKDFAGCRALLRTGNAYISIIGPSDILLGVSVKYNVSGTCNGLQNLSPSNINGTIQDGSGGFLYFSSQTCRWYVNHTGDPEALIVVLRFDNFSTQNDGSGRDYVTIWDRNTETSLYQLDDLSGDVVVPRTVISENPTMMVKFVSDSVSNKDGFLAFYNVIYQPSGQFTSLFGFESFIARNNDTSVNFVADVGATVQLVIAAVDKFQRVVSSVYWRSDRFQFILRAIPESLSSYTSLIDYPSVIDNTTAALNLSTSIISQVRDIAVNQPRQAVTFPTLPNTYRLYLVLTGRRTPAAAIPAFQKSSISPDGTFLKFRVIPSAASSSQSTLVKSDLCDSSIVAMENPLNFTANVGQNTSLCLIVRDRFSNVLARGGTPVRVFIIAESFSILSRLTDYQNGYFRALFLPRIAAVYEMTVSVSGSDVPNSPFALVIPPGPTAPQRSTIVVADKLLILGGQIVLNGELLLPRKTPFNITIRTYDAQDNEQSHINDIVSVNISSTRGRERVDAVDLGLISEPIPAPPSDFAGGIRDGAVYIFTATIDSNTPLTLAISINGLPVLAGPPNSGNSPATSSLKIGIPIYVGTRAIESWHRILGVLGLVINILLCIVSVVLVVLRSHILPLKAMSRSLLLLTTLGCLLFLHFPLVQAIGTDYPCDLFLWLSLLAPVIWMTPILLSFVRLRFLYPFSALKRKWAKMTLDVAGLVAIQQRKEAFNESRFIMYFFVGIAPAVVVAIALAVRFAADVPFGELCGFPTAAEGFWGFFGSVYYILLLGAMYSVSDYEEVLGFRKEAARLIIYGTVIAIVAIILRTVGDYNPVERNDAMFIVWLIPIIYQFRGVLMPALYTFNFFAKARKNEVETPLNDLLNTKRGFDFFYYFTSCEFSQENPLCYQAMENYRKHTTIAGLQDIYTKFLAPGSPLQVNLAMTTIAEVKLFIDNYKKQQTSMEQLQAALDTAQGELMNLMLSDSYRRFLSSPLYESFLRGDRAPREDSSRTGSKTAGATSNNSADHNGDVELKHYDEAQKDRSSKLTNPSSDVGSDDFVPHGSPSISHHHLAQEVTPAQHSRQLAQARAPSEPSSKSNGPAVAVAVMGGASRRASSNNNPDEDEQERFVV